MKYVFLLLIVFCACNPAKRIARICKKHPEACVSVRDSVLVVDTLLTESVSTDTVFAYHQTDTVYINKDRLKIKYKYLPQTKEVYVAGECETDTVYYEKKVPCPPVQAPVVVEKRRIPWLLMGVIAVLSFFIGLKLRKI